MLGEWRAAAEYLAAAQKHNDAFNDRDNMIRSALAAFIFHNSNTLWIQRQNET